MIVPTVIDRHLEFGFGSPRSTKHLQAIYIHTTENDPSADANNVVDYQLKTQSGSYHYMVDRRKLIFCNTDDWFTWSTANAANSNGLHLALVGWAADPARKTKMLRADWLREESNHGTLTRAAWQIARWCKTHNIPAVLVDAKGLRAGVKGISTHDSSRLAWGVTTHWDPGPDFPMDVLIQLVNAQLNPPKDIPAMTNPLDQILTATDGTRHSAGDLIRYTDGRVYTLTETTIPELKDQLDRIESKLDRLGSDS